VHDLHSLQQETIGHLMSLGLPSDFGLKPSGHSVLGHTHL